MADNPVRDGLLARLALTETAGWPAHACLTGWAGVARANLRSSNAIAMATIRTAFLSSTSRDLRTYREAVLETFRKLDDWKCICMEDFGARDAPPLASCLTKVAECDLFVALVGDRFGSHPPAPHHGKSFTQHEYEEAMRLGKPRLVFMLDEGTVAVTQGSESKREERRQQRFRNKVLFDRVAQPFSSTPDKLAARLLESLRHWEIATRVNEAAPVGIFELPWPRNQFFVGRDDVLETLEVSFRQREADQLPQIAAITGLGGIGKTQTALEYAYRSRGQHRVTWWLPAATTADLDQGVALLAQALGLAAVNPPETSQAVRRWLERERDYLLVLDNAEHPEDLRAYLPANPGGCILITSRYPRWSDIAELAPLTPLSEEHATTFLQRRVNGAEADAFALAKALGYLPLALEQAAAYMEQTGQSASGYIALYESRFSRLATEGKPSSYPQTILTTWDISLAEARRSCPVSADLLRLLAFLAPDDVPRSLLLGRAASLPRALSRALDDGLAFDHAVGALRRYSLIQATGDSLGVHRLVQTVTRARMTNRTPWANAAIRLLADAFPEASDDFRSWPACARLRPHADAALRAASGLRLDPARTACLFDRLARFLESRGEFDAARTAYRDAVLNAELAFGADHTSFATHLNSFGLALRRHGAMDEAHAHLTRSLEIRRATFGPDHPVVAVSLNNIGLVLLDEGELAAARRYFEQALALAEAAFGAEFAGYPNLAVYQSNVGKVLLDQGDFAAAQRCFERALEMEEAAHGHAHPNLAIRLNLLGLALQGQSEDSAAEICFARAVQLEEENLGPDHPRVAIRLNNLALARAGQGDLTAARPLLERALSIAEGSFGAAHEKSRQIGSNLAELLEACAEARRPRLKGLTGAETLGRGVSRLHSGQEQVTDAGAKSAKLNPLPIRNMAG